MAETRSSGTGNSVGTLQRMAKLLFPLGVNTTNGTALVTEANKAATIVEPVTDVAAGRAIVPVGSDNWFWMSLYGNGINNATGLFQIYGWRKQKNESRQKADLWVPTLLVGGGTLALGAKLGVDGSDIDSTNRWADTLAIVADNTLSPPSAAPLQTAAPVDGISRLKLDYEGFHLIEVELSINASSATGLGGIYWTT